MEEVLHEAKTLAEAGVKELTLVAQNTTAYGQDLDGGYGLEHLLAELAEISELAWVRVLYGHPDYVTDPIIETIAAHDSLCPYFDIPMQHISGSILKSMGRSHNSEDIVELIDRIRRKVPGGVLRTTLMVGFPGETERDFEDLLDFVKQVRFDHMGAFAYSDENDLPSNSLKAHVAEGTKQERFDRLMTLQAAISRRNNQKYVGTTRDVLVDGTMEGDHGLMTGRAAFQALEVDGVVYINQGEAEPGSFVKVKITEAQEYDLTGDMV
jgi:ribosomal protein S12 methylthiotransferase